MSCVGCKACVCPPACPPFLPPPLYHVEVTRWEHVGVAQQIATDAVSCKGRNKPARSCGWCACRGGACRGGCTNEQLRRANRRSPLVGEGGGAPAARICGGGVVTAAGSAGTAATSLSRWRCVATDDDVYPLSKLDAQLLLTLSASSSNSESVAARIVPGRLPQAGGAHKIRASAF